MTDMTDIDWDAALTVGSYFALLFGLYGIAWWAIRYCAK